MNFLDTHAHLTCDSMWPAINEILARMQEKKVKATAVICTNPIELQRGVELHKKHSSQIVLAAATGPNEALQEGEAFFVHVEAAANKGWLQAIGETGLDLHWNQCPLEDQKRLFIRYMQLAERLNLPLVIHCREAFQEMIVLMDEHLSYANKVNGVFHCFAMGLEEAQEVIKRGFLISFSGIVTYKSAQHLQEVACSIDPQSYVLETDSPYLNPGKKRSQMNEPANIALIASQIANWRNESVEDVAHASFMNACELFRLPKFF